MKIYKLLLINSLIVLLLPWTSAVLLLEDQFEDGTINNTLWNNWSQDAGTTVTEEGGVMNISAGPSYAHTGGNFYTQQNFSTEGIYHVNLNFSYDWSGLSVGHSGLFFVAKHCYEGDDCRDTVYYGTPVGDLAHVNFGATCAVSTGKMGIFADDDSTAWHCSWEDNLFTPGKTSPSLSNGVTYEIDVYFDSTTGNISTWIDGAFNGEGTMDGSRLTDIVENGFKVEFHNSHYPYTSNRNQDKYYGIMIEGPSQAEEIIDVCNYTEISSSTTLTAHNSSCFNITSSDVTFDCDSYKIYGTGRVYNNYSLISANTDNITVKNCFFLNWSNVIYFNGVTNYTILNNTFLNTTDYSSGDVDAIVIKLLNSDYGNISRNNITFVDANTSSYVDCYDAEAYGIKTDGVDYLNIEYGCINEVIGEAQGLSDEGCNPNVRPLVGGNLDLDTGSNIDVFTMCVKSGYILLSSTTSSNYNISNSTFYDSLNTYMVSMSSAGTGTSFNNNNFSDGEEIINIATSSLADIDFYGNNFEYGTEAIYSNSFTGEISNNVFNHFSGISSNRLIDMQIFSGAVLDNNTFNNITGEDVIYMFRTGTIKNSVLSNFDTGITFASSSDNSQVINTTFINASQNVSVIENGATGIDFTNCSFDKSKLTVAGTGTFFNYYFLQVNVTDESENPINNAEVNFTDINGLRETKTTMANGLTQIDTFLEFNKTSSGIGNYTPYNLTAFHEDYSLNSTETGLDFSKIVKIILESGNCWEILAGNVLFIPTDCIYKLNTGEIQEI